MSRLLSPSAQKLWCKRKDSINRDYTSSHLIRLIFWKRTNRSCQSNQESQLSQSQPACVSSKSWVRSSITQNTDCRGSEMMPLVFLVLLGEISEYFATSFPLLLCELNFEWEAWLKGINIQTFAPVFLHRSGDVNKCKSGQRSHESSGWGQCDFEMFLAQQRCYFPLLV